VTEVIVAAILVAGVVLLVRWALNRPRPARALPPMPRTDWRRFDTPAYRRNRIDRDAR
jgi:hypothetical protein